MQCLTVFIRLILSWYFVSGAFFSIFMSFYFNVGFGQLNEMYKTILQEMARDTEKALEILNINNETFEKNIYFLFNSKNQPILMIEKPDDPDLVEIISRDGMTTVKLVSYNLNEMSQKVIFTMYTKENSLGRIFNLHNLADLNFDSSKNVKILIHGFRSDATSKMITSIRNAYLAKKNVNVITVDWGQISKLPLLNYIGAARATKFVGIYVATMINSLAKNHKVRYEDIHLIGHSLGAHVSGFAGSNTKEHLGRITALDPAAPYFEKKSENQKIDKSDAKFIDVIHTSCLLGLSYSLGHVDFFPNGGYINIQPGCNLDNMVTCDHEKSHEFFAESIEHTEFNAVECSGWHEFKSNNCSSNVNVMGEHVIPRIKGNFYLTTDSKKPFALGRNGITDKENKFFSLPF